MMERIKDKYWFDDDLRYRAWASSFKDEGLRNNFILLMPKGNATSEWHSINLMQQNIGYLRYKLLLYARLAITQELWKRFITTINSST